METWIVVSMSAVGALGGGVLSAWVSGKFLYKTEKYKINNKVKEECSTARYSLVKDVGKIKEANTDIEKKIAMHELRLNFFSQSLEDMKKQLSKFGSNINSSINDVQNRLGFVCDSYNEMKGMNESMKDRLSEHNKDMKEIFEKINTMIGENNERRKKNN